jgi:hypothetical protein
MKDLLDQVYVIREINKIVTERKHYTKDNLKRNYLSKNQIMIRITRSLCSLVIRSSELELKWELSNGEKTNIIKFEVTYYEIRKFIILLRFEFRGVAQPG